MTPRSPRPDLSQLSHEQKDALIYALLDRVDALVAEVSALKARVAELEAKLNEPPKTPDNSSTPPPKGQKANRDREKRKGPRAGSVGRKGGGRGLAMEPDQFVSAKAARCRHCGTGFSDGDHGEKLQPLRRDRWVFHIARLLGWHVDCVGVRS